MGLPRLPRLLVSLALALAAIVLAAPAIVSADTTASDNWSGYGAHGKGVTFSHASAIWRQPTGTCTHAPAYSAFWVGLGGYSLRSNALEQIGTELDCTSTGHARLFAWYELVPAPARPIEMTVAAGDMIRAGVAVAGNAVTFTLIDSTQGETFTRTIIDHRVDVGSAEWIAEAPSNCSGSGSCRRLTLADFGSIGFANAQATTTAGRTGSISSDRWDTTRIVLGTSSQPRFASDAANAAAAAIPSALTRGGHAFTVRYTGSSSPSSSDPGAGAGGAQDGSEDGPPANRTRNSR